MYLCICNALKDREFKAAAQTAGARDVVGAFKACNARPKCGRCLEDAAAMILGLKESHPAMVEAAE
ncbi:(2Fe-2S)-binding protein [Woodsholea maritima]|uniref:(2Fe-2S)-binding protein n=1 Tax=Woodsholea maritima TaxID=240237 RepID=UPI00036165D0|nr:(2Fe-2S)-binding protein [Woodsholea maritima]